MKNEPRQPATTTFVTIYTSTSCIASYLQTDTYGSAWRSVPSRRGRDAWQPRDALAGLLSATICGLSWTAPAQARQPAYENRPLTTTNSSANFRATYRSSEQPRNWQKKPQNRAPVLMK
ncbi:MAG TPA: hypothetical protein DCE55_04965 [Planctomycetaceae bacterium]|nr:hypothetical protein [Planctomycetaceae bacterium]